MSAQTSAYSDEVQDLFARLPGAGSPPGSAGLLVTGEVAALERGAWVRFDARVQSGRILACGFRAWGCPHVLAASAWTAARLVGSAVSAAEVVDARGLMQALDAPAEKLGGLLVVEDAARALFASARAVQCV